MTDAEMRDKLAFEAWRASKWYTAWSAERMRQEWDALPAYDREVWWLRASKLMADKLEYP